MFELTQKHMEAANRPRRVVAHVDGNMVAHSHAGIGIKKDGIYYPVNNSFKEDYNTRLWEHIDDPNFKFDSIHFDACFEDEFAFCHRSTRPQVRSGLLRALYESGVDVYDEYISGCRERGLECILSHRIFGNPIIRDGINEPAPFGSTHPECFIDAWMKTINLASAEIRELKLDMLTECMENYAFDGLEIDFCRHTPFLEPGKQWELREHVTEFMRMLREMTLRIEKEQNRPILLSARVSESIENCHIDGLDIETWAKENLVDTLTLGSRSFEVDIDSFRKATDGKVKLFPCFDLHHQSDAYHYPEIDIYAGVFSNFLENGADAVCFFNPDVCSYETYMKTNGNQQMTCGLQPAKSHCAEAMCLAGDREAIRAMDKTYVVERRGGYPWGIGRANQNLEKQLPMVLPGNGRESTVIISVGDDVANREVEKITLSLVVYGLTARDRWQVKLNDTLLSGDIIYEHRDIQINLLGKEYISGFLIEQLPDNGDRYALVTLDVDKSILKKGKNEVVISVNQPFTHVTELEKVEIGITYLK